MKDKKYIFSIYFIVLLIIIAFLNNYIPIKYMGMTFGIGDFSITIYDLKNYGAAFGILSSKSSPFWLALISCCVVVWSFYYTSKNSEEFTNRLFLTFSLALFNAGITLNAFERLYNGYVHDFIKLNFINFPVFNLNDCAIIIGAILIFLSEFFHRKNVK